MKKKLFFSTLCFILLLIMMLSTTLAWFTDNEANVNTMVAGKISIKQTVVEDSNVIVVPTVAIKKEITVENDGNLPCYVRTLIAFEDAPVAGTGKTMAQYLNLNGLELVIPGITNTEAKVQYTRDGITYTIGYYVHPVALEVDTPYTCLNSFTLDPTAPSAWNEACKNPALPEYHIMVLSQAVQTAGFEPAQGESEAAAAAAALSNAAVFGVVNDTNVKTWFDYVLGTNP